MQLTRFISFLYLGWFNSFSPNRETNILGGKEGFEPSTSCSSCNRKIIAVSVFAKTPSLRALPLSYFPHSGLLYKDVPSHMGFTSPYRCLRLSFRKVAGPLFTALNLPIVVSVLNLIITLSSIVDKYSRRDSNPQISIRSTVFFPLDYPSSTPDRVRTCIACLRRTLPIH